MTSKRKCVKTDQAQKCESKRKAHGLPESARIRGEQYETIPERAHALEFCT